MAAKSKTVKGAIQERAADAALFDQLVEIRLTVQAPRIGTDVVAAYVRDAVAGWSGQLEADDARRKIKVVRIEHLQWTKSL